MYSLNKCSAIIGATAKKLPFCGKVNTIKYELNRCLRKFYIYIYISVQFSNAAMSF